MEVHISFRTQNQMVFIETEVLKFIFSQYEEN